MSRHARGVSALLLLFAPSVLLAQSLPRDGTDALTQMHVTYAGVWYHTLTFAQKTTQWRADGSSTTATWYESLRYVTPIGSQLRIDIGSPSLGNGVLYTTDSSWTMRGGTLAGTRADGNAFLPLIEGVYMQPVARTVADVERSKVDLARVAQGKWNDRPVWIVGALTDRDTVSPQFWVDAERKVVVRVFVSQGANALPLDIHLDDYVPLGGGWLATKITMLLNGAPRQMEEYSGWKADVDLPAALFSPATWSTARHWAGGGTR